MLGYIEHREALIWLEEREVKHRKLFCGFYFSHSIAGDIYSPVKSQSGNC
jgi:hypothetical protein